MKTIDPKELASYLEAGAITLAFQSRMHKVIIEMEGASKPLTLSTVLAFGRKEQAWMTEGLFDALHEMDVASAAAAATSMRLQQPRTTKLAESLATAAVDLAASHPSDVSVLCDRIVRARAEVPSKTAMTDVGRCLMDALTACRTLSTLAADNGSILDAESVLARYADAPGSTQALEREPVRVLCRAFGASNKDAASMESNLARMELVSSLTFMAYELCYRDGLVHADARRRFDELAAEAQKIAARQRPMGGKGAIKEAMTETERASYEAAIDVLRQASLSNTRMPSGRVFLMCAPKVSPRGQAFDSLNDIRRDPVRGTQGALAFLSSVENAQPAVLVEGLFPLYVDPETPSMSLRDTMQRALHATGEGKLRAGDILCVTRSEDGLGEGPMTMYGNLEAATLCRKLREAGLIVLTGIPNEDAPLAFEAASDGRVKSAANVAKLVSSLLQKHRLDETAALRLRSVRRAALTA